MRFRKREYMLKKRIVSFALAMSCALLCGCSEKISEKTQNNSSAVQTDSSPQTRDIFAMDTYMNLKAYGENASQALADAEKEIVRLENILSVTKDDSDINKINSGTSRQVSEDTANIINAALRYGDSTDGALDITIYPVLKLWGFTTGEYKIPKQQEIDDLLENVNYSDVEINGNTVSVPENAEIDLGALAKGYTGDRIMQVLKSYGIDSAIISLGGNVQALGTKPDGSQWKVSVRNPFAPDTDMCIVSIDGKAVITSGNYERYFQGDDGEIYWHIIDPADGYPADNGIVSATVIGDEGLMCDSLSTSLFIMGREKAEKYWRENGGFDMILVTDDGKILYTNGIAESFENISNMPAEIIK